MYRPILIFILIILFVNIHGQEKSYPEIDNSLLDIYTEAINSFDFKKGVVETNRIIKKSEKLHYKKGIGRGYFNISNFLTNLNLYKESLKYLEIAEINAISTDDYVLISYIYLEYGKIYGMLELHQRALEYFDKAIASNKKIIIDKTQKKIILQIAYACKAESSKFLNRYDSMYIYFKKAYKLDPDPITGSNIAEYFIKYNRFHIDSADYYLRKAELALGEKTYDAFQKLAVLLRSGDYYYKIKNYEKALEKYLEAERYATQIKSTDVRIEAFNLISKTYSKLNDEKKSTEFLKKYTNLSDSLKTVNNIALNLSVEKLVSEKDKEKESLNKRNYVLIGIISLVALTLFALGYLLYIKKKREKEVLIKKQQKEIEQKDLENKNLENKVNDAFEEVIQLAKKNDPAFLIRFQEVYPNFIKNIKSINPKVSNSELHFYGLAFLNFSTKEIADFTFVTIAAVQLRKHRIRKKYNIPSDKDFNVWMRELDLL